MTRQPSDAGPEVDDAMRVAVIVVNYGSHKLIGTGIDSRSFAEAGIRVVVVDNFSTMDEREAIEAICRARGWTLVISDNDGFGAAMNRGASHARQLGCHVMIALNPDARADAATVTELAARVFAAPRTLISPMMEDSQGRPHFTGATVSLRDGQIRRGWYAGDIDPVWKNWLSGACLAIHLDSFEEIGGFDTTYFLYWEDVELSLRAGEAGMVLEVALDLRVVHDEGGTHNRPETRAKSPIYYYYNTRNRLVFATRHADRKDRLVWLISTPRQSLLIWLRGGKCQLFSSPQGAWAALRGTMAGLLLFVRAWTRRRPEANWG